MSTLDDNRAPSVEPKPEADPKPAPEEDEEDIEEVDQTPHFDFIKEYYAAASAKKSVRQLPALVRRAMRMVWSAGPFHFVFSTVLQLLAAAAPGHNYFSARTPSGLCLAQTNSEPGSGTYFQNC